MGTVSGDATARGGPALSQGASFSWMKAAAGPDRSPVTQRHSAPRDTGGHTDRRDRVGSGTGACALHPPHAAVADFSKCFGKMA